MKQALSDSIEDFRRYRVSQGMTKATLRNDKQVLTALLTYCGNIYTDNVSHQKMTEFIAGRTDTRGASSIGIDVTKLRLFYAWAEDTGRCPRSKNPMRGRKPPRAEKVDYPRVALADFPLLLQRAGERSPRDRAFIALGLFTMGRASEICSLKVGDLDLNAGRLHIHVHKSKTYDDMPLSPELDHEMRRWLTAYSLECGSLEDSWFLVPARVLVRRPGFNAATGVTRLNPTAPISAAPHQIVQPALRAIGWTDVKGTGVHPLRRSSAHAAYLAKAELGYDHALRFCQEMLHHADPKTTEGYINISGDKARRDDMLREGPMFPGLPSRLEIGAVGGQGEGDAPDVRLA